MTLISMNYDHRRYLEIHYNYRCPGKSDLIRVSSVNILQKLGYVFVAIKIKDND